jgi:very-short-patch-repair endonuclease
MQSKYELLVFEALTQLFPNFNIIVQYPLKRFKRVPKNISRTRIDIYIPELKTAIEIDGEHHFKPVNYGGELEAQLQYEKRIKLDNAKDAFLAEQGITVIRIPTSELNNENVLDVVTNYINKTIGGA